MNISASSPCLVQGCGDGRDRLGIFLRTVGPEIGRGAHTEQGYHVL